MSKVNLRGRRFLSAQSQTYKGDNLIIQKNGIVKSKRRRSKRSKRNLKK